MENLGRVDLAKRYWAFYFIGIQITIRGIVYKLSGWQVQDMIFVYAESQHRFSNEFLYVGILSMGCVFLLHWILYFENQGHLWSGPLIRIMVGNFHEFVRDNRAWWRQTRIRIDQRVLDMWRGRGFYFSHPLLYFGSLADRTRSRLALFYSMFMPVYSHYIMILLGKDILLKCMVLGFYVLCSEFFKF